jgi:NADH:ubiquinone oxidoreductase subunit 6 (subunit J)
MDHQTLIFWIIAGLTGLSAIAVVVSQNIVRSAVWLLFALGGTAGVYFLIGADFVGATQLIVYVGGILVLIVFGVMLTAQGPFISMRAGAAEWAVALVVGVVLFGMLAYTTAYRTDWVQTKDSRMQDPTTSMSSARLGLAFLGFNEITPKAELTGLPGPRVDMRSRPIAESASLPTRPVRQPMGYLLPFEIISVHLLVVLIAAAYLARAKRRRRAIAWASK